MSTFDHFGKLPHKTIQRIVFPYLGVQRPEVLARPGHGLDNAVVDIGNDKVMIVTTDLIQIFPEFGFEDAAWFAWQITGNDITTCGHPPQYILAVFTVPVGSKEEDLETPVIYDGIDEYQRVCGAFDEMRIRLKDSLYEQLRYEENRKELLANITHDLKTPITAIKGYMEGIRDGIADTPERVDKYLDTIYSKSVLMNDLIDRLFLFSKLDLGKIQFHFQSIALGAFLLDTCEELKFDYPSMEIHLDEPEKEIHVHADPTHLHRVIANLIDNAQKYSNNEEAAVNIIVETKGSMAEVTIRDNGPGIADEDLPRIFKRFHRGDASRSSRREGSGLGLSIARQIIMAHGGSIAGKNSRNGGLEILLTLRRANEKDTHN